MSHSSYERATRFGALALLAAAPLALSACGGSSTSATQGASTQGSGSSRRPIARYGSEATASQAQPVEAATHAYLAVLAAGELSNACSHLAARARSRATRFAAATGVKRHSCAGVLAASIRFVPRQGKGSDS